MKSAHDEMDPMSNGRTMTEQRHAHHHRRMHEPRFEDARDGTYDGRAIASLVLGVIGFVLPVVPSTLAVVLGRAAHRDLQDQPTQRGGGMAVTGITLGWAGLALFALLVLAWVVVG